MCGIFFSVSTSSKPPAKPSPILLRRLQARGPDHTGHVDLTLPGNLANATTSGPVRVHVTSTVLALRGCHTDEAGSVTKQPFIAHKTDLDGHATAGCALFCWNGEAWRIGGTSLVQGTNDGDVVFSRLMSAAATRDASPNDVVGHGDAAKDLPADANSADKTAYAIVAALRDIEGPFAFVFVGAGRVWFGRDRLGRRSLLLRRQWRTNCYTLCLSSVAGNCCADDSVGEDKSEGEEPWAEVEADGVYSVALTGPGNLLLLPERVPWTPTLGGADEHRLVSSLGYFNVDDVPPVGAGRLGPASASVVALQEHLQSSLALRLQDIPQPPAATSAADSRVAVLFSGGLDCSVIARMADEHIPREQVIDLLNVAFENPRIASQRKSSVDGIFPDVYESCPDRITGRKSFAELTRTCASRIWRFVQINVPYSETLEHREEVVSLMLPHNTEMDLSIAYALYFAGRGQGLAQTNPYNSSPPQPYATTARVLLSGLGADELFGGYVRHATAYSRRGYPGLVQELHTDVARLGKRNLGRDDRVLAHWGREVRLPFLDESLVRWAVRLPVWEKCDFSSNDSSVTTDDRRGDQQLPVLGPEKRVLRLLAVRLGLAGIASEKKRAIQFGARTAKMETGKTKGTNVIVA